MPKEEATAIRRVASIKRVASAISEGSITISFVHQLLNE